VKLCIVGVARFIGTT